MDNYLQDFLNLDTIPTDFDNKFISNFINMHLTICEKSLIKLASHYRHHLESTGKSTEIILAFYIEILRKMCETNATSIIDKQHIINFLLENESIIFNNGQTSATLRQMGYDLLCTLEFQKIIIPFKTDINVRIIDSLISESTNLYVRRSVENLAINHLRNIYSKTNATETSYLLFNIMENLLEADFYIIIDSLSKVVHTFVDKIEDAQRSHLIDKAKVMKRIGYPLIELIAAIL